MAYKIQIRRDTSTNWIIYNPVLDDGEFGFESDTRSLKIGDGVNAWNDLDYYFISTEDSRVSHVPALLFGGL